MNPIGYSTPRREPSNIIAPNLNGESPIKNDDIQNISLSPAKSSQRPAAGFTPRKSFDDELNSSVPYINGKRNMNYMNPVWKTTLLIGSRPLSPSKEDRSPVRQPMQSTAKPQLSVSMNERLRKEQPEQQMASPMENLYVDVQPDPAYKLTFSPHQRGVNNILAKNHDQPELITVAETMRRGEVHDRKQSSATVNSASTDHQNLLCVTCVNKEMIADKVRLNHLAQERDHLLRQIAENQAQDWHDELNGSRSARRERARQVSLANKQESERKRANLRLEKEQSRSPMASSPEKLPGEETVFNIKPRDYLNELKKQMFEKTQRSARQKEEGQQFVQAITQRDAIKREEAEIANESLRIRQRTEFLAGLAQGVSEKQKRRNAEIAEDQHYRQLNEQVAKEAQLLRQHTADVRRYNQQVVADSLRTQMQAKTEQKQAEQRQKMTVPYSAWVQSNANLSPTKHQCAMYPCASCHREYPRQILTKRLYGN
jgi:hypothetical protein